MNSRERKLFERLHSCLDIPAPAVGTQSTTLRGIAGYSVDMQYAVPRAKKIMRWISTEEPYEGAIEEELESLKNWFDNRKNNDWK